MAGRLNSIRMAQDLMKSLYLSIENDIYRMYHIPCFPDGKGHKIIDREITGEDYAERVLPHLKQIQKGINRKIKWYGFQKYGIDLSDDMTSLKIHILKPGKGQVVSKTIYSHYVKKEFILA